MEPGANAGWTDESELVAGYIFRPHGGGLHRSGIRRRQGIPIFALAQAPTGSLFHEAIYTTAAGLSPEAPELEQLSSAGDRPVPNAKSDHVLRAFVDNEIPEQSGQPPE